MNSAGTQWSLIFSAVYGNHFLLSNFCFSAFYIAYTWPSSFICFYPPQMVRIQVCKIVHCNVNEINYHFRLCSLWNMKSGQDDLFCFKDTMTHLKERFPFSSWLLYLDSFQHFSWKNQALTVVTGSIPGEWNRSPSFEPKRH